MKLHIGVMNAQLSFGEWRDLSSDEVTDEVTEYARTSSTDIFVLLVSRPRNWPSQFRGLNRLVCTNSIFKTNLREVEQACRRIKNLKKRL